MKVNNLTGEKGRGKKLLSETANSPLQISMDSQLNVVYVFNLLGHKR